MLASTCTYVLCVHLDCECEDSYDDDLDDDDDDDTYTHTHLTEETNTHFAEARIITE